MKTASAPLLAATPGIRVPASMPTRGEPDSPARSTAWPISILGVPFDHVTIADTLRRIDAMIASRQPHYLVTANVDFLVQAHRDVELRRILLEADLVLCDGTPLVWASRWLGNALPERVAGSDLAPALMRNAAEKGHRIFFLGAGPGVAAEATAKLCREYPRIQVVGHYAPPFSALLEMDHEEIGQRIRAAQPDILLVGFGCPKQEKWIAMHYRALGVPVCIGVGATIDFLAGRVRRAPAWMRRSGTEWLYRLIQEPRRLYKRYANDFLCFVPTLLADWWRLSRRPRASLGSRASTIATARWFHVDAGASLTIDALQQDEIFWRDLPQRSGHCLLDTSSLKQVDGTGVAYLLRWRKTLQGRGHQLVLVAPHARFRRLLDDLRLEDYFPVANDAAEALRHMDAARVASPVLHDSAARGLAWCGEIIAGNVEDVWQLTSSHIREFAAGGSRLVIIDLSRLRFIDSAGAGLMLRVKKWAQQFPAEVLFTHAQPNVRNVLRLTRLDQLLLEGAQ